MWKIIGLVLFAVTLHSTQAQVCNSVIDMVFLVDGSGSICDIGGTDSDGACTNWKLLKLFIKEFINDDKIAIGANDVRVGLVTFANEGIVKWNLAEYTVKSDLANAIDLLDHPGGNTNTSGGIYKTMTEVLNSDGDRPNVLNIIILITDGKPTREVDDTVGYAEELQRMGKVFSIGITDEIDTDLLKLLASPSTNGEVNYFESADFDGLRDITQGLLKTTCEVTTPAPSGCADAVLDLTLIVDGSGSICDGTNRFCRQSGRNCAQCGDWPILQIFLGNVVERLAIGPQQSHVALVTFASSGVVEWDLNRYTDKASLSNAVRSLRYPDGSTNTVEGLQKATTDVFGRDGDRPNVKNVAIVITDGKPTRPTLETADEFTRRGAQQLKDSGVLVYAVGIGVGIQESTLQYISSPPSIINQNYFTSPDFETLNKVLDTILSQVCETTPVPVTPRPTPAPAPGCSGQADVVFIVDSSGSIGEVNYQTMRRAISELVNELDIESGRVKVAIIRFSDNAEILFDLNRFNTRSDIADFVNSMDYVRGTTNTASALDMAVDRIFQGDRSGVPNIAVVLTDGGSNDKKMTIASAIRAKRNMNILTIGIGSWTDEYELQALASHPYQTNYIEVERWDDLRGTNFRTRLRNYICNNVNECNSNPCHNGGTCIDMPDRFLCRCPPNYGGTTCDYFCRLPADVVFALDASGSIGKQNFFSVINFAKSVVQYLPVGEGTSVGLLTFGDGPERYFDLRDYNDMEGTMNGMTIPYFSGGTTNTASALRFFRSDMFTTSAGWNDRRPKLGVVITDGRSNDEAATWAEAISDRSENINIMAVGVGSNVRYSELRAIASYPTENNVMEVENFSRLEDIASSLRDGICNAFDDCDPNPCGNGGRCIDLINGYECRCSRDYTGTNCERRCNGDLDVLFIIDKSGSIRHERFGDVKQMIANTVNDLEVFNDKVRVAAISFSDDAQVEFRLNSYQTKQDIMEGIMRVSYAGGRTNIASALQMAGDQIFQNDQGDRTDSQNVVFIFSDGGSNIRADETIPMAIKSKIAGMQIFAVAVGRDINMVELRGIASNPFKENIYSVDSFSKIGSLTRNMIEASCNDMNECSSNPCRNGGTCVDDYMSYTCLCPSDRTGRNCERNCRRQYDLLFILDLSGSVDDLFDISVNFVNEIIYGMEFRFDNVRAALITYSDEASAQFYLNTYTAQRDILNAIAFSNVGGRTNTQRSLSLARDDIFRSNRGDRNGVTNKIMLLTDGGSNIDPDRTLPNAAELKRNGAEVHVIGIGERVDMNEVNGMASGTNEPFVFRVRSEEEAISAAGRLLDNLCR